MAALVVSVRLTPRSAREAIDEASCGPDGLWSLKARVRAVPEDGKANAALLALVAKTFRVPKSAVTLEGGGRSRDKRVRIEAHEEALADLLGRLEGLSVS